MGEDECAVVRIETGHGFLTVTGGIDRGITAVGVQSVNAAIGAGAVVEHELEVVVFEAVVDDVVRGGVVIDKTRIVGTRRISGSRRRNRQS